MKTNDTQESDAGIVARKRANAASGDVGESVERRAATDGNPHERSTGRAPNRITVDQSIERIRQYVQREPEERLTTLLHHVTPEALRRSYFELKRDSAAGVDGITWQEYGEGLDERLHDLHRRVHTGAYRASPSRRVYIPKPDGRKRPLGIAALEDKVLQKAVADILLTPIYEAEFLGFSYGFRPGRGAHDALDALGYAIEKRNVNWILDADIEGFFDAIDRESLMALLEKRIADRRVLRLVEQWLRAGVMEGGSRTDSGRGTPQGAVISPLLANVFLHYALDTWLHATWRQREARGEVCIVRYADDFVLCCERRDDAERLLEDLRERMAAFGLRLHPEKTRLLEFGRNAEANRRAQGRGRPETFDFLGFTHYCRKTRGGRFGLGRKPMAKRARRTQQRIREVLRRRRHGDVMDNGRWLGQVLAGWLKYYAVPTSSRYLERFVQQVKRLWMDSLRRRSQKDRTTWERLEALVARLWPRIRIQHPWPDARFAASHRR